MKTYEVEYRMYQFDKVHTVEVGGAGKGDAWLYAIHIAIPKKEGSMPYSAWTARVKYKNGKVQEFNTFEGKPY